MRGDAVTMRLKGNQLKMFNKTFGDWFVLHQLYKNMHHTHYIKLISKLCEVISS